MAFLVAPSAKFELIDEIVRYNRKRWGGRYNPIIVTDGENIGAEWLAFLRQYDPDIIKATLPLSDGLRKKLQTFLSPAEVELYRDYDGPVHLDTEPLAILPNKVALSRIARDFAGLESSLVLFRPDRDVSANLRHFLERNFGLIDDGPGGLFDEEQALQEVKTLGYPIGSVEALNTALLELGEYHQRVVFPSQLCSTPNYLPDASYDHMGDRFAIVVGDSQDELIHLWNRRAALPHWLRTSFTDMWLPAELANSPELRPGLVKFLNRFVGGTGNQNSQGALFLTCSLDQDALEAVVADVGKSITYPRSGSRVQVVPRFSNRHEPREAPVNKTGVELYRGHSTEEHLVLSEPDRTTAPRGDCWFADIYVQFRPERFRSISGKSFWWQLPARNSVLTDTRFFNRPARIKKDGFFSVLMRRTTAHSFERGALIVKIPNDETVAWSLICGRPFDHFDGSVEAKGPFSTTHPSDKGQTLAGVLSLFPDLLNADHIFQQRLWRRVFAEMSNQSDTKDKARSTEIYNALKKHQTEWERGEHIDEKLRLLAERTLNIAKSYSLDAVELRLADFIGRAIEEAEDHNALHPDQLLDISSDDARVALEEEMKDNLSTLMAWHVLLAGLKPKCPSCGFRIWYPLNDTAQEITCKGCGSLYALLAEQPWRYQLNSLVRAAVTRHGTIPVLIVIGQLMQDARSSFIFVPPTDLLSEVPGKRFTYKQEGDLDIVCVVDGKFVIGEVKTTTSLFKTEDFDKMLMIAKAIRPDRVLFSALDGEVRPMIRQNIDRLNLQLAALEVAAEWYPLREWYTEPSPLRWPTE